MPHRKSNADRVYEARGFKPMVGPMTSREFDASTGYCTSVGALIRAAAWRRLLAYRGDGEIPSSWCRVAHAACVADAKRFAEKEVRP